jgi:hypothetical protein
MRKLLRPPAIVFDRSKERRERPPRKQELNDDFGYMLRVDGWELVSACVTKAIGPGAQVESTGRRTHGHRPGVRPG